jgi:uncharacterized protein
MRPRCPYRRWRVWRGLEIEPLAESRPVACDLLFLRLAREGGGVMQLTRFNVVVRDFPVAGEHVLYNTLTDQLVGLDDRALAWIDGLAEPGGPPPSPPEPSEIAWLEAEGFLVKDDADDDARLMDFMLGVRDGDGTLLLTMMVTETCNLACPYCFEGAGPTGPGIGAEVEDQIHQWVARHMSRHGLSHLNLQYFGGEPLLRKSFILRTAKRFHGEMAARGGSFSCNVITNGVLLDRPFVEAMVGFGLRDVKVTLDGDQPTHDTLRIYRDGRGSWDRILENLKAVAGAVPIRVGANVPNGEERAFEALIARLEAEGLREAITELNFKPIMSTKGGPSCGKTFSEADLTGLVRLKLKASDHGFGPAPNFDLGPCGLHMAHYLAVDPHGYLYKCEVTMADRKMAVGHVADDAYRPRVEALEALDPVRECEGCSYLPVCAGGCRAVTLAGEGHLGANCEHDYFETVGREILKRRYLDEFYEGVAPSDPAAAPAA